MILSRSTRALIILGGTIWPVTGITTVPLVSAALAVLIAHDGITTRTALVGLAITLIGALLAGLPLMSQSLPWLVALVILIVAESFLALASRGIARACIIGFVVFCLIETLTILGAGLEGGSLIARLSIGLTEYRIGAGALVLAAFLLLLYGTEGQSQ